MLNNFQTIQDHIGIRKSKINTDLLEPFFSFFLPMKRWQILVCMKYSFWFELTFFSGTDSTYTAFTKLDKKKLRLLFIPKGLICATFGTRERHSKEGFLTLQLHFNNNKFFSSSLLHLIYLNQHQRTLRDLVHYIPYFNLYFSS